MTFIRDLKGIDTESPGRTAIESVYVSLRQAILDGRLEPGSRLRVEELRKFYDVGSSTVREALSRLLVDKLVTSQEQRGFHVAPVSLEDFQEITELRILLETQAVRDSIRNGDDAWENRLVSAAHQLAKVEAKMAQSYADEDWVQSWESRNSEFHNALVSACTNSWLLRFRATVFAHSSRYRRISVQSRDVPRDVRAEHQRIFDTAIARDVEGCVAATAEHIENSIKVLSARVADWSPRQ